ncbi:hypothetical protein ACMFMG_009363 [Clarireedia jacksonii]
MVHSSTNLDPLPGDVRNGMIAMGLFGLLSTISTFTLMSFITYRMIYWKRYYDLPIHRNQVFVLIYNLLLADFQQALSFLLSFYWVAQGKLVGGNSQCFAQGWLVQIGDVSSGLWVLAIAIHTFVNLVAHKQIGHGNFVVAVVGIWVFCLLLTAIGPILSKDEFFVPAGAWCWVSDTHEHERLYLHYLWIFTAQLGSLVIYISVFFSLRGRLLASAPSNSRSTTPIHDATSPSAYNHAGTTTTTIVSPSNNTFARSRQRIHKTARYMVVYPFSYVALTLPLAAARVSTMAGNPPPLIFFPVAGSFMASCGVIDVLLYISTRKALVRTSVGMHSRKHAEPENELRKLESGARARISRLKGLEKVDSEDLELGNGASVGNNFSKNGGTATGGLGDIVVRQTIVQDSEESQYSRAGSTATRREDSRGRSDSVKSLVGGKVEFTEQQKGWRA